MFSLEHSLSYEGSIKRYAYIQVTSFALLTQKASCRPPGTDSDIETEQPLHVQICTAWRSPPLGGLESIGGPPLKP